MNAVYKQKQNNMFYVQKQGVSKILGKKFMGVGEQFEEKQSGLRQTSSEGGVRQ